jgi:hypothetical protein
MKPLLSAFGVVAAGIEYNKINRLSHVLSKDIHIRQLDDNIEISVKINISYIKKKSIQYITRDSICSK